MGAVLQLDGVINVGGLRLPVSVWSVCWKCFRIS